MRLISNVLAIAICAASVSFGAVAQDQPSVSTVLATVDGTTITLGQVIALRDRLPEQYKNLPDDVLLKGVVDQLIQQTILMNAIKDRLSPRAATALENQKRAFLASEMLSELTGHDVSDKDIRAAYAAKYDSVIPEQEFNASHILVKTKVEAQDLIKQLNDGADFASLAKDKSTGPSGKSGGELGWFSKGQMVKPFEDAVKEMAVGEISPPVETQFGWHVIKLNDMRSKPFPTLDDERAQLTTDLKNAARDAAIAQLTAAATVDKADINIDPAVIRDVTLFDK